MKIDLVSGLPEVPEGHYWEVKRANDNFGTALVLHLFTDETKSFPVTKTREVRTWRTMWFLSKETYVEEEERVSPVSKYSNLMADREWVDGEGYQKYLDEGWTRLRIVIDNGEVVRSFMERLWEPTAVSILRAAAEIMTSVNAEREKLAGREAQNALIGKYPPKSLEDVVKQTEPKSDKKDLLTKVKLLEKQLKDLQAKYDTGLYTGHPEEMLDLIADTKYLLDKLRKEL